MSRYFQIECDSTIENNVICGTYVLLGGKYNIILKRLVLQLVWYQKLVIRVIIG